AFPMMFLHRSIWPRKVIRNIGCLRRKDCAGEVQIVERTTSIKEAGARFAENLSLGAYRVTEGWVEQNCSKWVEELRKVY
ncbi:hypothetical protein, partial [Agathobacter ruminis]